MESIAKVHYCHQPLHLSLNPQRPSFLKPISSISLGGPLAFPPSSSLKSSSIRASCQTPKPSPPSLLTSVVRTTSISLAAAAALFFTRLYIKPAFAVSFASPPTAEESSSTSSTTRETDSNSSLEEQERALEQHLAGNPEDAEALRSLMEVKIKSKKPFGAIDVIDRLIELEPNDDEWPLLKYQIYCYSGDVESARKGFEEILTKDPLRVECYHGLVMASAEGGDSLDAVVKRIEVAMDKCRKEEKNSDMRDFKLLIAQIRVMEEKYTDALNVYEELVKEEPRDFRPYLCQGIIYTLLRKKDEAKKKFDQFKRLVPKNHPYREYLVDNMFATKFFSEKFGREIVNN